MNAVFELEVKSLRKLVKDFACPIHQWANWSTEQPRCSRSCFYSNWFVTREQQAYFQNLLGYKNSYINCCVVWILKTCNWAGAKQFKVWFIHHHSLLNLLSFKVLPPKSFKRIHASVFWLSFALTPANWWTKLQILRWIYRLNTHVMDQEFVVRFVMVNIIHLHVKKSRKFRNERTFWGGINVVFCVCQWVIVQTSVPGRKSVEFVTGQIIISQFVKWVLISQDLKHQLHQPMLKLRKIESLVQVRNLLRTSQQHPQQEARYRYFCKQLAHMLMLRIVPSYYLFVYYLIAEAKALTLQIIWRGNWVWYPQIPTHWIWIHLAMRSFQKGIVIWSSYVYKENMARM